MLTRVAAPAPDPEISPGQVLLRTRAVGLCGSDLPKFRGSSLRQPATFPGPLGYPMHEVVGDVVASRHPEVPVGAMVVGWSVDSTALAEYVTTDGDQVHEVSSTSDPVVAVMIQPLACVLYSLRGLSVAGRNVAVLGLGPIGLLFARELARAGARRVTGVDPVDRSDLAEVAGIDDLVVGTAQAWAASLEPEQCPDVVVEAVGHQTDTLQAAIEACAGCGEILYFGIPDQDIYPLDMERLVRKNLTLRAGITRDRRAMLARADVRLGEDLDTYRRLITCVLPFDRAQEAFERAGTPRAGQAKIVLTA